MTAPVVEFDDVCFSYGGEEVLHNLSFKVNPLDIIAVVGPNGGGKTTLLRLILGLLKPERGTVRVFGKSPAEARQQIGYVIQHLNYDAQFPVTVRDVVLMGRVERHRFGPYGRADRDEALQALQQVGMEPYAGRPFSDLSGGQRQRVLIAQALVTQPALLLLDEPTANIDTETEKRLFELFRTLSQRITIVIVSHNVNVVTGYVSHVLCVNHTATLNPVGELSPTKVQQEDGREMAVLHHELNCHVIDASRALHSAHKGHRHTPDEKKE
jgi:zinc transport system ATP-binding protein